MDVLVSPAGKHISKSKYAKEYYLLESLSKADRTIRIESYFRKIGEVPSEENLSVYEVFENYPLYAFYLLSCRDARNELRKGSYDLYHQLNFHYRFHNPLLVANLVSDVPSIIGPAQPPHSVPDSRMKKYIDRNLLINLPDAILDKLVPIARGGEHIINPPREFLFRKTLENVDRLVTVNEETAALYAEYMPRSKIEVIPIGVALDRFERATPSESTDIVSAGNLHYRKGFDVLLDAWSESEAEQKDATLHILGDGAERENLESQAKRLNISESVVFHGHVDHSIVVEMLASARAFVHPTRSEGYGHVRLEAMASGLPVIGTNITGAREMVRDGIDGVIVPIEQSDALASGISNLLNNPNEAQRMGENARIQAETKFDWQKIGEQYADLYKRLSNQQ